MAKNKSKADDKLSPNELNLKEGIALINSHPIFKRIGIRLRTDDDKILSKGTSAVACEDEYILLNKRESHTPQEWAFIIAHCMLHFCFGHFESENMPGYFEKVKDGKDKLVEKCDRAVWNMACDIFIAKFLSDIKFYSSSFEMNDNTLLASDEKHIYEKLVLNGTEPSANIYGTAGIGLPDMKWSEYKRRRWYSASGRMSYASRFAYAVSDSVRSIIDEAGGKTGENKKSDMQLAAEWFVNHYPLLGGLASGFKIIEIGYGSRSALNEEISVAAVDSYEREIYVNSSAGLSLEEWKFVLAHEYLHAGLQHHERRAGRDPYLWNVACDFVINGWLVQMHIGAMPGVGLLYDEKLINNSAEEIYDILVKDIRKNSKLETFRGYGKGDILDDGYSDSKIKPVSLDDFCRNALRSGLEYHESSGRGSIPAGLIEEIKALSMPPVPWDVELAKWFDINFAPIEKRRTYARPSRRQYSTPDIPKPSYIKNEVSEYSRTYAVIIDTSGSMSKKMIAMALGAAASYSAAKEVPLVRVVFCDASPYDIGYVSPEDIAGRVEVRGRGGTVIQPAVDLIEKAKDFPKNGPILIITDGFIENDLIVHHEHAFLIPKGNRLPFKAKGKVFYFHE